MRKIWYTMLTFVLLPISLILNACSIGVCVIQFETWGGSEVREVRYQNGTELDPNDFDTPPTKSGYKFINWCYKENLEEEISFPMFASLGTYTYYAKYEIDNNFFQDSTTIQWKSLDPNAISYNFATSYKTNVLFKKNTMHHTLHKIEILPITDTPGQGFLCKTFEVFNEQGKPVEDKNPEPHIFEPATNRFQTETFSYVLSIESMRGGDFCITIS